MRTSLLWPEFGGVHMAILVTLIGIVVAILMRRADRAQRLAIAYAFVFQVAGIVLLVSWLLRTDWMMGHYQGPPVLLFSALAGLALGIGATLLACVLSVVRRRAGVSGQATMRVRLCWVSLLILTLLSGFLSWGMLWGTPRALREVRLKHFEALESRGPAAIPQLVAGLKDEDPRKQGRACSLLGKLGPSAKEAVPDLIEYLERRSDIHRATFEAIEARSHAIGAISALGKIGPAAEPAIPVLVRLAEQEQSSWYVRRAVVEALQGIGASANTALTTVLEFTRARAARELPAQIAALKSTDLFVVSQAADFLLWHAKVGVDAQAALPALQERLAEIRQDPLAPRYMIEMAILHITRESAKRRR